MQLKTRLLNYLYKQKEYLQKEILWEIENNEWEVIGSEIYSYDSNIHNLINNLYNKDLLEFDVCNYCDEFDNYLHAEYYCRKIGKIIIIDLSFPHQFTSIEALLNYIERINKEIEALENKLK